MNMGKQADADGSSGLDRRSLGWLNVSQFLGALNDNLFKFFVIFFLVGLFGKPMTNLLLAVTGVIFVAPFLLFNAAAGALADRLSKRAILVGAKWMEAGVMALGLMAFAWQSSWLLFGVLFLMAAQSAFFGPAKYGIIPELAGREDLSRANSLLVMLTYAAIIGGTALAPLLAMASGHRYVLAQAACLGFALAGALAAHGIRRTAPADASPSASPLFLRDIWRTLGSIRRDGYLLLAVLGSAYFSLLGAYLQLNVIPYGMERLGLSQDMSAYLFLVGALGIAAGAWVAGRLSGRAIELGLVPVGSLLLTACVVILNLLPGRLLAIAPVLFLTGLGAGLFIIPVDAFIQYRAPRAILGRILAASSFLGWLGVLLASGFVALHHALGLTAGQGFLLMGGLTLLLTLVCLAVLPDFLLRFVVLLVTRAMFRVRVRGRAHVPAEGPALLVCNHVSYLDALLLTATQQRRIRFVMGREAYDRFRLLRPCFRLMRAILISPTDPPKRLVASFREARAALDDGHLVCIFAEGALTRSGFPGEFRRGFEHIVRNTAYPVIPAHLGGVSGTLFTYRHGRLIRRWSGRQPVAVSFGAPMAATATAHEIRSAVLALSADHAREEAAGMPTLSEALLAAARRTWRQPALADTLGRTLTSGRALTAAFALAGRLRRRTRNDERVGILLPPSVAGALANLAVTLLGKTAVNLNYTASAGALRSAIRQSRLPFVLSSAAFLARTRGPALPVETVPVEDLLAGFRPLELLAAYGRARILPARLALGANRPRPDSPAAVMFSSGSTAEPKGIVLTHANIRSNIAALLQALPVKPGDTLAAVLPLFHSLGYTGTLWLPLLAGVRAVYHPNPLDAERVARLVRGHRATLLFATPTFLALYLRRAQPGDFASLRLVIAGAEKLHPSLARAFEERFGLRPLEGYGATELSPVATLSVPHTEAGGVGEAGWQPHSAGRPLPGVAVRVIDPDSGRDLAPGETGMLLVKGPNVMAGYLGRPDLTADAVRDGWYETGDLARVDPAGFVFIQDRLARFSKIGGEMVPHRAVEDELHRLLAAPAPVLAVTAVPDERRGERLAVMYTDAAGTADTLRRLLAASPLPNLWKPAAGDWIRVERLPVLGAGKLDLRALKNLARSRLAALAA